MLGQAIDKYLETSVKAIGKTKAQCLRLIKRHPLAGMLVGQREAAAAEEPRAVMRGGNLDDAHYADDRASRG